MSKWVRFEMDVSAVVDDDWDEEAFRKVVSEHNGKLTVALYDHQPCVSLRGPVESLDLSEPCENAPPVRTTARAPRPMHEGAGRR